MSLNLANLQTSDGFLINGFAPFEGTLDNGESGIAIAGVGDVNSDGIDDLVFGQNVVHGNGLQDSGESYIVFGQRADREAGTEEDARPFFDIRDLYDLDDPGSAGYVLRGTRELIGSGWSVAGPGDVSGDGDADILIGAPARSVPDDSEDPGEVYLVYGGSNSLKSADLADGVDDGIIQLSLLQTMRAVVKSFEGSVSEDGILSAEGRVLAKSDDGSITQIHAMSQTLVYGDFSISKDGLWLYTLNNDSPLVQGLISGQPVTETIEISSQDGLATKDIVVTIDGLDDIAQFSGQLSGEIGEDNNLVSGKVDIVDPDNGEAFFEVIRLTGLTYGSVRMDSDGSWEYT